MFLSKPKKLLLHPLLFLGISHRERYSTTHVFTENCDDDASSLKKKKKKKSALDLRCVRNSTLLCTTTIFAVCRNPDINSSAPNFKVHNLRAAFQDSDDNIVHLIREPPIHDGPLHKFHMKMAKLVTLNLFSFFLCVYVFSCVLIMLNCLIMLTGMNN